MKILFSDGLAREKDRNYWGSSQHPGELKKLVNKRSYLVMRRKRKRSKSKEEKTGLRKMAMGEEVGQPSSSFSSTEFAFDAFLSFDQRDNGYTLRLFEALVERGVRVAPLMDAEETEEGEKMDEQLTHIELSQVFVPVISMHYAQSRRCLREMAKMVECGRPMVPLFFDLDPSVVVELTETFGSAEFIGDEEHEKDQWRKALKEVAGYCGLHFSSGQEEMMVPVVVKEVVRKLNKSPFNVAKHPVGIESRVEDVINLLYSDNDHTNIIGIQGVGGIGKTTIAKAVYNQLCDQFQARSFLFHISEKSKQLNGLACLRGQLISDISKTGIEKDSSALVVLDDVDCEDQIEELLYHSDLFGAGSKIIITTRDEDTLIMKGIEKHKIYKPEGLDNAQSLKLFSHHAFQSEQPLERFLQLSEQVVQVTGGLPLELEVFGSLFYDIRTEEEWEAMLVRLVSAQDEDVGGMQHERVQERLRIAYEQLDSNEKRIFLDIACFFIGRGKEYAMYMWEACGFHPQNAIRVLLHRSLIQIDGEKDEFVMHDRVRDMGREIVLSEGVTRSRFWNQAGITEALQNDEETKEGIEGIFLNLEEGGQIDLGTEAFEPLLRLRMLRANFVNFSNNDFCHFPEELKWLEWRGCPLESLPLDCKFNKLSILILSQSNITQLWKEPTPSGTELDVIHFNLEDGVFDGLKVLDLSSCAHLSYSPGFASVPRLQKLILDDCPSLTELDESLGCLKELKFLSMRMCRNLIILPDNMHRLVSLKNLFLGNCSKLSAIPKLPSSLITLDANNCTDLKMAPDFSNLTNLKSLNLQECKTIACINGFGGLESIEVLLMDGCESLSCDFMGNFKDTRFKHLKELSITGRCSYSGTKEDGIFFMFPLGSENDPLLMDYVHCHGHVFYRGNHGNINSTMVCIRYYDDEDGLIWEYEKEACRDGENDLGDLSCGFCYTHSFNGNDEAVSMDLTAWCNKISISTADGSLLERIDIKFRHKNYSTRVNNDLQP